MEDKSSTPSLLVLITEVSLLAVDVVGSDDNWLPFSRASADSLSVLNFFLELESAGE